MHAAIGRLRGKAPPDDAVLDKLLALNPRFRVGWLPPHSDWCHGLWGLYDRRGDHLYRAAGAARLARYQQEAPEKVTAELWYACESMIDGDHLVSTWTDQQFGSDWMFRDVAEGERQMRDILEQVEASLRDKEQQHVESEYYSNAAFRESVDAMYPLFHEAMTSPTRVVKPDMEVAV